jgi:hypothetical protein
LKQILLIITFLVAAQIRAGGQAIGFSIATDLSLQRSFKEEQRFWAVGQTVQAHFHFAARDGIYLWMSYYTEGEYSNQLTAVAKSPATIPQSASYRNDGAMRFKQFSLGFKKYLKGSFNAEESWNIYAYGGFGLLLGRVVNTHHPAIDSNDYALPVREGKANFKRLTLDLGAGVEYPIGADIYLYGEGRAWVPTTDYPSRHIFVNDNAPFAAMANLGLRILF